MGMNLDLRDDSLWLDFLGGVHVMRVVVEGQGGWLERVGG